MVRFAFWKGSCGSLVAYRFEDGWQEAIMVSQMREDRSYNGSVIRKPGVLPTWALWSAASARQPPAPEGTRLALSPPAGLCSCDIFSMRSSLTLLFKIAAHHRWQSPVPLWLSFFPVALITMCHTSCFTYLFSYCLSPLTRT